MTTHQPSNQDLIRATLEILQETAVRQAESDRRLDVLGAKLDQEREERLALAEQNRIERLALTEQLEREREERLALAEQSRIERLALAEQLEQDRQAWRSGFEDTINLVSQGITQLGDKIDALGDKIERLVQAVTGYQGNGR